MPRFSQRGKLRQSNQNQSQSHPRVAMLSRAWLDQLDAPGRSEAKCQTSPPAAGVAVEVLLAILDTVILSESSHRRHPIADQALAKSGRGRSLRRNTFGMVRASGVRGLASEPRRSQRHGRFAPRPGCRMHRKRAVPVLVADSSLS